jgi:feruloyl-CoA synthase
MSTAERESVRTFADPHIERSDAADGRILLRSTDPLAEHPASVIHEFRAHADAHPERLLIAERVDGDWARTTWGEMRTWADGLAAGLLARGLDRRPVMVLSHNSRPHLALSLAAMTLGTPVVPVSQAYSLQSTDHAKLAAMVELVDPGVVFAQDGAYAAAVAAVAGSGRTVVTGSAGGVPGATGLDDLVAPPAPEVDRRAAALRPGTVAKILFTSGSTGTPKGVINTHGMLAANQQQIRQAWPFLADEPPVLLDWLPWSHTFAGNHDTNLVLCHGGTLYLDDGRPAPGLVERTVANLAESRPTIYLSVPAGYAALLPHLERDDEAARAFFARLRLGFFAAAALPQGLWDRLTALAEKHGSTMRMTTSWGMTETSPCATTAHFPITRSDCLGVPVPGVELALAPVGDKHELRLRGPNVTPGYHRRPDLAASTFDEHGFLRTGDAVALADPDDPAAGLVFRGRIAEDFKLSSGTFVSVGTLRPLLLSAAAGLFTDAVLCGENTDAVAALAWLHPDHAHRHDDGRPHDDLRADIRAALDRLADAGGGSSQRIERVLLLTEPAVLDAGEITDKGYVNQRAVRDRRAALVAALTAEVPDDAVVVTR